MTQTFHQILFRGANIAPGERRTLVGEPFPGASSAMMRPEYLQILQGASSFVVNDIRVAGKTQLTKDSDPIPGDVFAVSGFGPAINLDPLPIESMLEIDVTCTDDKAASIEGRALGKVIR